MEIDAEDGSTKLVLKKSSNTVFGREHGFNTTDRTTSRQHLLFQTDGQTHPRVTFQVLGKNPIWVKNRKTGDINVFRKSEHGEVAAGDWFCVSGKYPVWFHVKEVEEGEGGDSEVRGSDDSDGGANVDVSSIDPVKEFGFLVIGHEFDHYPRKMLQKVKDWDWFLEEPSKDSDEDEDENGKQKGQHGQGKRKRRKKHGGGNEDEEWTGESEEELTNVRKFQKTKYHTRSKHPKKASKRSEDARKSVKRRTARVKDEEEEEEDDETLGGFIVTDEEAELEEDEEEEEEEFIDDDEDD